MKILYKNKKCVTINNISEIKNFNNFENVVGVSLTKHDVLDGLEILVNLEKLYCVGCNIHSLEPISGLTSLKVLDCSDNPIGTLKDIKNLCNLHTLMCHNIGLNNLDDINNLVNLRKFYFTDNHVLSLVPLSNLTKITDLYFMNNKIDSLDGLQQLGELVDINCDHNFIKDISILCKLQNIRKISCWSDHNVHIPNDILGCAYLERLAFNMDTTTPHITVIRLANKLNIHNKKNNLFNNNQNVHDSQIQDSLRKSIINLLKDNDNGKSKLDIINEILSF